jgi:nicotinamidase-related amidase
LLVEPGTLGFDYAGSAIPKPDELVVDKTYFDAFAKTTLATHLRSMNVGAVVCIGGYAARCVLATAFGANGNGFDVVMPIGLVVPHPDHHRELTVVEDIMKSVLGYLVEPEVLQARWAEDRGAN